MSLDYESFLVAQLEVNMHILGLKSQSPFPTDHSHNVPKAMMEHCQHKANSPYVQQLPQLFFHSCPIPPLTRNRGSL